VDGAIAPSGLHRPRSPPMVPGDRPSRPPRAKELDLVWGFGSSLGSGNITFHTCFARVAADDVAVRGPVGLSIGNSRATERGSVVELGTVNYIIGPLALPAELAAARHELYDLLEG
jgi:hypothetical protein